MTASILFLLPIPKIWSLYLTLLIISEICFSLKLHLISFIIELYHFVHFIQVPQVSLHTAFRQAQVTFINRIIVVFSTRQARKKIRCEQIGLKQIFGLK